ncbi:TolC family protein [Thermostilla marina]
MCRRLMTGLLLAGSVWLASSAASAQEVPATAAPQDGVVVVYDAPTTQAAEQPEQADAVLRIAELHRRALQNNPTLVQATRKIAALRARAYQAGLPPNPQVGYSAEEIGDEGGAGLQGAVFSQQLLTGGKLSARKRVYLKAVEQAVQEYELQRRRVENDVDLAAVDVLVARENTRIAEHLASLARQAAEAAEQLYAAQEVGRTDVIQTQIELEQAEAVVDRARFDEAAAWRRLAALIGEPDLSPQPLEDRLDDLVPELDWESVRATLWQQSPEIARAAARIEQARARLAAECAERAPDIDVELGVHYNDASDDTVASVGFGMPLKVFDRNTGNIRAAEHELAAAQQELRRVELELQARLADAFREYEQAKADYRRYRDRILPNAEQALAMIREGYRQGELGLLDLLNAQRTYFQAQKAAENALGKLWKSAISIRGLLVVGALEPIEEWGSP